MYLFNDKEKLNGPSHWPKLKSPVGWYSEFSPFLPSLWQPRQPPPRVPPTTTLHAFSIIFLLPPTIFTATNNHHLPPSSRFTNLHAFTFQHRVAPLTRERTRSTTIIFSAQPWARTSQNSSGNHSHSDATTNTFRFKHHCYVGLRNHIFAKPPPALSRQWRIHHLQSVRASITCNARALRCRRRPCWKTCTIAPWTKREQCTTHLEAWQPSFTSSRLQSFGTLRGA